MNRFTILACSILLPLCACGGGGAPPSNPPPSGSSGTQIADIQGDGATSPLEGQIVSVEGVVSGDFQDNDNDPSSNLQGFFIQAEFPDSNASTSDGLFVYDGGNPTTDVSVGDRVTVTGTVQEFFGETQIAASSVSVSGTGMIRTTDVTLPVANVVANSDGVILGDLEHLEGMLIRFAQTLTVTDLYNLERFGEVAVSQGGRLRQYTNSNAPDAAGYTSHREADAARSLLLDDGLRGQNIVPVPFLESASAAGGALRIGSSVSGLTGALRFSRGSGGSGTEAWRLVPTTDPAFNSDNPRPGRPAMGGSLRVASFNVLNFFSTVDSGQSNCGPNGRQGCRGADSDEELRRQLEKITTALAMIDADIIGLIELENNDSASLQAIVDSLNAAMSAGTSSFLNTGTIGGGAIKTGFVYRPASVTARGSYAILNSSVDARFNDNRNRPALAQTFVQKSIGATLTIVVNHLKSKGSSCDSDGDPNIADGQGNCNKTRTSAATAITDWLQTDPTSSNDPDFLIIGDLNAYLQEDPLTALRNGGFTSLVDNTSGGKTYSYVFGGQSGALDHALASATLVSQVTETIEWHINADEARAHDYNLENGRDAAIFDGTSPYRASDHDPIIIGLDLN